MVDALSEICRSAPAGDYSFSRPDYGGQGQQHQKNSQDNKQGDRQDDRQARHGMNLDYHFDVLV